MFKDEYTKHFDAITPSPALEEETLALMQEAQAHALPKKKQPQKMRWVLPVCVSGAAAMLALTVGLAFWVSRPDVMDDIQGQGELFLWPEDSVASDGVKSDLTVNDDADQNSAPTDDQETIKDSAATLGSAEQPDENKGTSEKPSSDSETPDPEQEHGEEPQPDPSDAESNPPAQEIDPKAPVEISDKKTETYLSLKSYLDSLSAKKTIGYKTNYLTEEALVIVPTWLPTTARFRQVYAYANSGYTYSYLLSGEDESYFLNVAVSATAPKTQRDLLLRVKGIRTEEKMLKKADHQWTYYFGNYDRAIVTVTTLDGKAITMEQAAPLLTTLDFARYTVQNTLVEMAY